MPNNACASFDDEGREVIPRVLGHDPLVVAVGSVCNDFGTPGVAEHAIKLDNLDEASVPNRRLINACLRANAQYEPHLPGQLDCAIIGAGQRASNSPPSCTRPCGVSAPTPSIILTSTS